ncbi:MAG: hypothetical protein AB1894_16440 [Chloroflexota bacterium]
MYIDPNTGGMLFQMLAMLLAVFSGVILIFSSRIRAGIARLQRTLRGKKEEETENKPEDQA